MAAQAHLTADEQLLVPGQLVKTAAQLVEGDVQRPRNAPQLVELGAVAHIYHQLMGVAGLHLGKSATGTAMTVTTTGTGTGMIAVAVMSSVAGTDVTVRMIRGMAGVTAVGTGAMTTDLKI